MVKHIHVPIPNQRSESASSHVVEEGAVRTALTSVGADGEFALQNDRALVLRIPRALMLSLPVSSLNRAPSTRLRSISGIPRRTASFRARRRPCRVCRRSPKRSSPGRHKTVFAEQDAHDLAQCSLPVHPVSVEHVGLALGNQAGREIAVQSARVGDWLLRCPCTSRRGTCSIAASPPPRARPSSASLQNRPAPGRGCRTFRGEGRRPSHSAGRAEIDLRRTP